VEVGRHLHPSARSPFTVALVGQVCYFSAVPVQRILHRRMMKKKLKPLLIGLAVLIAALTAGALIYAQLYLTPKVIENTLSTAIQEQLLRRVSFREIEVGLFKGIILRGVTVHKGSPSEKDDLLTCDEINLSFSFAPLLLKKLVVRSIECTNPRLHVQSDRGGPVRVYGTARPSPAAGPAFELFLLPGSVLVHGGTLSFFDKAQNIDVQLANVQVDAPTISYIMPFDVTASASFANSATPDIQITVNCFIPSRKFSAELDVPEFNFVLIRQYLSAFGIPLNKGAGSLNLTVKGSGDKHMQIQCKAALKDVAAVIMPAGRADDEIGIEGLGANIEIQADYDVDTGSGSIKKIQGAFLSSSFEGGGTIQGSRGTPDSVAVTLNAGRLSLDELSGKLYYGAASPLKGLRLGGLMGLRLDFEGKADSSLFPTVTANLYGGRIMYPPLGTLQPEFNGGITLIRRAISLSNLRIGTPNINVVLAGDIINYLQWPPEPNVRVVSSTFNLYQLVNDPGSMQGEDIGPFDFGYLKFEGPLEIGTVPLMDVELSNVQGAYLFENNRFSIKNLSGGVAGGGSFNISSSIDLKVKGLEYTLTMSLAEVPLQTLNDLAFVDLSKFIDGTVTGSIVLGSHGTKPATFLDSLTGDAAFKIKNCRMKGFAMPEQLDRFIKKGALTSISFTDADLQLKLRRDAIEVSGAFISPQAELHPSGQVGLNAELHMQAQLKLATDVFSGDTKIADYLPREGSWVVLPVVIKGALDNPSVTLSDEAIRHIMQVTLPRLFMDMLEKAKSGNPAEAESEDDRQ
jgi:hypothetical protein